MNLLELAKQKLSKKIDQMSDRIFHQVNVNGKIVTDTYR